MYMIPSLLQLFAFKLTVIMPPPPPPPAPEAPKGLHLGPIWVHPDLDDIVVRMPDCPPLFDRRAKGDPNKWEEHFHRTSGKKAFRDPDFLPWQDEFPRAAKREVKMQDLKDEIMTFLKVRPINRPLADLPYEKKIKYLSVLDFLTKPEAKGDGWYRFRYKPNEAETYPKKAYHGTRLYCVYCILIDGLYHSDASTRILSNTSGVYAHEDRQRAEGYVAYNPLFSGGIFWGVLLELGYSKVVPLRHEQLALQDAGLIAVWFHGARFGNVPSNRNISPRWDPLLEASPFDKDDDGNSRASP